MNSIINEINKRSKNGWSDLGKNTIMLQNNIEEYISLFEKKAFNLVLPALT